MKLLFLISFLCVFVASSRAAVARGVYKDPKHPGKCAVKGLILSPGEEAQQPDTCGRMICGDDSLVVFHTCGVVSPPPGYKLGEPIMPNEPYPECCRKAFIPII